jgi:hypothetical protein
LFGCDSIDHIDKYVKIDATQNIQYIKDKKTGLCFAIFYNGHSSASEVPCDKVERFLLNP